MIALSGIHRTMMTACRCSQNADRPEEEDQSGKTGTRPGQLPLPIA